jgi:glutamate--cysteine ligase
VSRKLQENLASLQAPDKRGLLTLIQRGIEKECLRIDPAGKLAQTPHPRDLGSALTHPSITTDYSEALLEFITPVDQGIASSLETLEQIHSYVYQHLGDEILWSASMPCVVSGDEGIPIAHYGSSNVAQMKAVYRRGLGHRYGRMMQAIAGIHYNFSMPESYWRSAWADAGSPGDLKDFITERYLGLIRNFRRYSWLLIYLYGASPAVCASFLRGQDQHSLVPFDEKGRSLYLPHGTALRMGDLGYNSAAQKGLNVCYNSLDKYIKTLTQAIMQPHPDYADIPCGSNGQYEQLNDSLLQIENEFYSPIRPKRVAASGETPLGALQRGGIEYIEVRCVDVSPFTPVGLDAQQIRFLDIFLLYCLLEDSPDCDEAEQGIQTMNMSAVVNRGREPGLVLQTCDGEETLQTLGTGLLEHMRAIAQLLDEVHDTKNYSLALTDQFAKIIDPDKTPSARVLREMTEQDIPFFRLMMKYSLQWAEHFRSHSLDAQTQARLEEESAASLQAQAAIEASDSKSFDQYLIDYYAQYKAL